MSRQSRLYLGLTLACGVLLPVLAHGGVDTAWVRRYDGPAHGDDWATRLAVDSVGNVYVVGASMSDTGDNTQHLDFATIKSYPNGDTAWVRREDFGGKDLPSGLGVDAQGNVYVTGTNNDSRMVTVKYSPTGNRLWYEFFGSQGGANDLVLDSHGNIIVCGSSCRASLDAATVKYRPNGDTAWVRYYNWAGFEDWALAVDCGPTDGLATTGYGATSATHVDCATVAYDSLGSQRWSAGYDGPNHGVDVSCATAIDDGGDVVAAGYGDNGYGTPYDYLTIKYDSLGETLWTRRYNGPASGADEARAVALDRNGGVYVTGRSEGAGSNYWDYATVKYDSGGTLLWSSLYDGPAHSADGARDLAVDASGCVYVTGSAAIQQSVGGCVTIKYNPAGDTVWVVVYVAPPAMPNYGSAIAVGADGCVFVVGNHGNDIMTIKYVQSGGVAEERRAAVLPRLAISAVPNPIAARTEFRFAMPSSGLSCIRVLDVSGRVVRTLRCGSLAAGQHSLEWDRTDDEGVRVAVGVYMVVLDAVGMGARTKVMVLE